MEDSSNTASEQDGSAAVGAYLSQAPQLPQDIIELIVDESSDDLRSLAVLCRLSKNYSRVARKHLYYELDLIAGKREHAAVHSDMFAMLSEESRRKRRTTMQQGKHLWQHIRSLAITLHQPCRISESIHTNTLFLQTLQSIQLSKIENVYIGFGTDERGRQRAPHDPPPHFRVVNPVRQILETLLSSNSLKRFSMEINTVWGEGSVFPGWIFRNMSSTAAKLAIRTAYPSTRSLFPWNIDTLPATNPSQLKRHISEFDFAHLPASFDVQSGDRYDSVPRWWTILSALCFNFDFSQTKKLTLPAMWNGSRLALPDEAAGTLEELTIHQFPNAIEHLSLPPDHFYKYRSLHTLALGVHLRGPILKSLDYGCSSLVTVFSSQVPPSLRRVSIQVRLGTAHGEFSQDALAAIPAVDSASWRELDRVLAHNSSLRSVGVHLQWRSVKWSDYLMRDEYATPAERKAAFGKRVQSMLKEWRTLFRETNGRGILDLRYTHYVIPSSSVVP